MRYINLRFTYLLTLLLYGRRFFTGRKTQPTVSKYWRHTYFYTKIAYIKWVNDLVLITRLHKLRLSCDHLFLWGYLPKVLFHNTLCSEKNTHSHFLSYLHELFVNLNINCSEYAQGLIDSENVKIRYSLRSMT